MEALRVKVQTIEKQIEDLTGRMCSVEQHYHEQDKSLLVQTQTTNDSIRQALENAREENKAAFERLDTRLETIASDNTKQRKLLDERLEKLETADARKAKEELQRQALERADNKKWIRRTVIACIVTGTIMFFLTVLLNQILLALSM